MNYEKAYKEALERARQLYNEAKANEYQSDMEDYERIFPELAESEDEKIRKDLINYFNGAALEHREEEVIAWLEKQGEQKPVEWSEKDESIIERIIDELKARNHIDVLAKASCDIMIDWLKSLRPQKQWKPSEEQMKALKEASDKDWDIDGNSPLYRLYEQLKAL